MSLVLAQEERHQRGESLLLAQIDGFVDSVCDRVQLASIPNYQLVGPAARHKLKGLINYYRKKPHPWQACVNDNTKRFGPEGAKKVCSVLTDLERGTTKWRKGGHHGEAICPIDSMQLDQEVFDLLYAISQVEYKELLEVPA